MAVEDSPAYREHVLAALEGRDLRGLRLVVDTAMARPAVWRHGCSVPPVPMSSPYDRPDGSQIYDRCGATDTASLAAASSPRARFRHIALDGDADRMLAVDHEGRLSTATTSSPSALDLRDRGGLRDDTVVVTVMANLGFRLAMEAAGIRVIETAVGDRYVLESLDAGGHSLGGEQSGHVIFRDFATTGDGVLTGMVLGDACAAPAGRSPTLRRR